MDAVGFTVVMILGGLGGTFGVWLARRAVYVGDDQERRGRGRRFATKWSLVTVWGIVLVLWAAFMLAVLLR